MLRWRPLLIGAFISAACIYLSLSQVDPSRVGAAFAQADGRWLLAALVSVLVSLVARTWKWQLLFLPAQRVSFGGAFSSTMIGYLLNALLPGRVGELVRSALLSQTDGVNPMRAIGTIFIEKLIDVLVLLIAMGALTAFVPLPDWAARAGVTAAVAFGALAVVFAMLAARRAAFTGWLERHVDPLPVLKRVPRLRPSSIADSLLTGADSLRYPFPAGMQALLTFLMWGAALTTNVLVAQAFQLGVSVPALALVLVATNLGMTVPAAPASLGVYHGLVVAVLLLFGVDKSVALAYAVALHALGFGTMIAVGAAALLRGLLAEQYTLAGLWQWQDQQHVGPAPARP